MEPGPKHFQKRSEFDNKCEIGDAGKTFAFAADELTAS